MSENKSAYNGIKHFVSGISSACDTNDENLIRILRDNEGTEFGRRFCFGGISSADEFSKAVPLAGYADFPQECVRRHNIQMYSLRTLCSLPVFQSLQI